MNHEKEKQKKLNKKKINKQKRKCVNEYMNT